MKLEKKIKSKLHTIADQLLYDFENGRKEYSIDLYGIGEES